MELTILPDQLFVSWFANFLHMAIILSTCL